MAETVTNIITTIRSQSDSSGGASTGFRTDAQILKLMQLEWGSLWDLLCKYNEKLFLTHTSGATDITLVSGTDEYSLPSTTPKIKKLCGVDLLVATGEYVGLHSVAWENRNQDPLLVYETMVGTPSGYILLGDKILFVPTPNQSNTVRLWYVPQAAVLVESSPSAGQISSLPDYVEPGWEAFVVDGVTGRLWAAQDSLDTANYFRGQQESQRQKILEALINRDRSSPQSVQLVRRSRR